MSAVVADCLRQLLDATATGKPPEAVAEAAKGVVVGLWVDSLRDRSSARFTGLAEDLARGCTDAARQIARQADGLQRASSRHAVVARRQAAAMLAAAQTVAALTAA
jgi:hypothetical protein